MNKDIINLDKQGNLHGQQIYYHSNDNITWIENYNHGKYHGYIGWFNDDKSIAYKSYWNMGNRIYSENHGYKKIEIKI